MSTSPAITTSPEPAPGPGPLDLPRPLSPASGSAVDPLVEEISWSTVRLIAASPRLVAQSGGSGATASAFGLLTETLWAPGRAAVISELSSTGPPETRRLQGLFGVGVMGSAGTTLAESTAVGELIRAVLGRAGVPFQAVVEPPEQLLDIAAADLAHTALIRQRSVAVADGDDETQVLSRWAPTVNPWQSVARLLMVHAEPVRVRATVLPTQLAIGDQLALEEALTRVRSIRARGIDRPGLTYLCDRVETTLVDLVASFDSPLLCVELAVASRGPLPEVFLRALAACFTSESDVQRRNGYAMVAGQALLLGGFDLERDPPGLGRALQTGVPLCGGMGRRGLHDLCTLSESPIGWPVPVGEPVPTIDTAIVHVRPVPPELDHGTLVGYGSGGAPVRLPPRLRQRSALLIGATGTGKTTVLVRAAVEDLHVGRGFLLLDPHGDAADRVAAHAADLDRRVIVLDGADGATATLAAVPALTRRPESLLQVEAAAGRFADAVASSLGDPLWAGPRWRRFTRALVALTAAHHVELAAALHWINDEHLNTTAVAHPLLPTWARDSLAELHSYSHNDSAALRDYAGAKLDGLSNGPARRLLARAGRGVSLAAALAERTPVICNLAALPLDDTGLVGHLILAGVLDAAIDRGPVPSDSPPYTCYVDEAHRFPVRNLERVLYEGRKFGVALMLGAQSLTQLPGSLADAASAAAVTIAFRQTPRSADALAGMMDLSPITLSDQPDLHAYLKATGTPTCSLTVPAHDPAPPDRPKAPVVPFPTRLPDPVTPSAATHDIPTARTISR